MTVDCNYCQRPARLVLGPELYPHRRDLAHVKAWRCDQCDAQVGCHDGTTNPKGTLAKRSTKHARMRAHAAFDRLWKNWSEAYPNEKGNPAKLRRCQRDRAYWWLSHEMGSPDKQVHIGEMDEAQCACVLQIIAARQPTPASIRAWAKARKSE